MALDLWFTFKVKTNNLNWAGESGNFLHYSKTHTICCLTKTILEGNARSLFSRSTLEKRGLCEIYWLSGRCSANQQLFYNCFLWPCCWYHHTSVHANDGLSVSREERVNALLCGAVFVHSQITQKWLRSTSYTLGSHSVLSLYYH